MGKIEAFERVLEERGGEDPFFDRLASTDSLEDIARDYGTTIRTLQLWKNQNDDRRSEWDKAMVASGHALAAEGRKILDDLYARTQVHRAERLESAHVALATARSNQRMKLAAARNPEYSDKPTVQVNQQFNIGRMHLEALKAGGSVTDHDREPLRALEGPRMLNPAKDTSEPSSHVLGDPSPTQTDSEE